MSVITAPDETKLITGEELLEMGDIGPCELIDGRIVSMSPTNKKHGWLERRLSRSFEDFVQPSQLGEVFVGEVGIYTRRNPDRVRGADIIVISKQRLASDPSAGFFTVAPEVIVEIVSPSDRWSDIRQKIEEYFAIGAEQVWIVEPENRTVLIYRSPTDFRRYTEGDTIQGEGIFAGFSLSVSTLFED